MASEVVIVGGGFGGLHAARRLERRLPGAAAGSLEPRHVVVPLREELDWTNVRILLNMEIAGGVGLFLGRSSAELGQLGHSAALREPGAGS